MSAAQPSSQGSTWTEPPWSGWIETTGDALLILEAARRGLIPRVTRRLVDSERKMITSGSVFVFDEDESGIKRWTDGFFWSPSRILGNFLLYRETDKRGAGHKGARSEPASDVTELSQYEGVKVEGFTLSRPKADTGHLGVDKNRERTLMGSLTNSYKFKPDGLMKKTFSLTIGGVSQHLISYYKIEDVENGRLRSPSSLPELASLDISPEYLDKTNFRNPPKVEIGVDGLPRYRGEADDIDMSPSLLPAALSSGPPLLTEGRLTEGSGSNRRGKRFDPYSGPSAPKRPRRLTKSSPIEDSSPPTEQASSQPPSQPTPYPDPNVPLAAPVHFSPTYGAPYYPMVGYTPHPGYSAQQYPPPGAPPPQHQPPQHIPQHVPQPQQGSAPPPTQYQYSGYPPTPAGDPSQSGQHAYYSYPPPTTGYSPGFSPVTWPQYPYPSQPMPHPTQSPVMAEAPRSGGAVQGGGEGS